MQTTQEQLLANIKDTHKAEVLASITTAQILLPKNTKRVRNSIPLPATHTVDGKYYEMIFTYDPDISQEVTIEVKELEGVL